MGNPTTYRGISLTWTRGRKLISYGSNTFEYDAQGQRTKKNGITYTYDSQGRILKQSNGLEFFYDTTGVAGIRYNVVNYVYRKDAQGNIIAILDSYGNAVVEYSYDAWGNNNVGGTSVTLGNLNPFRYRGYYYDTETKLYFLQTRYYDPEVGRFINIDNIDYIDPETINGLNLYAYCNNNPVNYYDPSGQFVISIGAGEGLGIAAAGAALLAWIEATFHPIENAVKDIGELIGNSINNSTDTTINIVPKPQISHPAFPSGSNGKQIDLINIATLISIINNIFLSRERNRGRDSGFIGISDEELEKLLLEAKRNHDSYMIQRILKEMKMRGMRNTRKQRGGPNMRGILLMFLLGGGLLSKFHENTN